MPPKESLNKPNEDGQGDLEHQNERTPNEDEEEEDEQLRDEGRRALDSERKSRRAAEKRASTAEAELDKLRKAQEKREEEEAEKLGEWEKLANERATRIEELENDIETSKLDAEKSKILTKYKLTDDEAKNVHGESIEDFEASAKLQAKLLGKNSGPNPDSRGAGTGNPPPKAQESRLKGWKFK